MQPLASEWIQRQKINPSPFLQIEKNKLRWWPNPRVAAGYYEPFGDAIEKQVDTFMSKKKKPVDSPAPNCPLSLSSEWRLDVIEELNNENDRGIALIGAAYIDTALKSLLEASMAGDIGVAQMLFEGPNAPLGTFSSRIILAYGLGHIGPNYFATLNAIRTVRNAFAHLRRRLEFEDPEIRVIIESTFKIPYILPDPPPDLSLMRNRYIWTSAMILGYLAQAQMRTRPPVLPKGG